MENDDTLRFEPSAEQARLPFDLDDPIPFELTARARRVVAPSSLPALEIVASAEPAPDGAEGLEDPTDTRAARARALRRAGMSIEGIAHELELEAFVVSALVDDISPVASARRRLRSLDGGRVARPTAVEDAARTERIRQRFHEVRSEARDEAVATLAGGAGFEAGLGLVVGTARIDPHAVLITVRDRELAGSIAAWLREHLLDDGLRCRVILRVAPQVAGDVERHLWAEALGLPVERVTITRWRGAPDPDAVEATMRLADPTAAGRLAGWREALVGRMISDANR